MGEFRCVCIGGGGHCKNGCYDRGGHEILDKNLRGVMFFWDNPFDKSTGPPSPVINDRSLNANKNFRVGGFQLG